MLPCVKKCASQFISRPLGCARIEVYGHVIPAAVQSRELARVVFAFDALL